eukprot:138001-Pleurochrysis_carterae.AAC.1
MVIHNPRYRMGMQDIGCFFNTVAQSINTSPSWETPSARVIDCNHANAADNDSGPSSPLGQASLAIPNSASSVHVLVVHSRRKRLCEDVRHVVLRPNLGSAPLCRRAPRTCAPLSRVGRRDASVLGKNLVLSKN